MGEQGKRRKAARPSFGHTRIAPLGDKSAPGRSVAAARRKLRHESASELGPLGAPQDAATGTARRKRGRPGPRKRYKVKTAWWASPVAVAMGAVLVMLCFFMATQVQGYAQFLQKKAAVDRATFYPGVSMEGQDLSGFTYDQALQRWAALDRAERQKYDLSIELNGQSWRIDADALGYGSDYVQQLQSAWSVGRYGTLDERFRVISAMSAESWRRDFVPTRQLDGDVATKKLGEFAASLSVEAVNAKVVSFNEAEKTFEFTDSKPGYSVDAAELYQDILRAAGSGAKTVAVNRHQIVPEDTAATLEQTYGLIASASTDASFSNNNRLTNLKVACRTLNGMRIEPGETFSFNKALGKRTAKAGYRPAAAYENGITTNQYGGGICQVSTTMFNAVAKADLKIIERSPHSRPSSYIGIGKDAAVNWPNQDFKFVNNSIYPVYITAQLTSKKKVAVAIYGKKLGGGIRIELSSETTKTYAALADQVTRDSALLPGEKVVVEAARKGYSATTYKHYLDANGKEVRKVTLCKSYYAPSGAIVRVGG